MEIMTSMIVPVPITFHAKSNGGWRGIRTRILMGRVPGSVVGGKGLASNDTMLESAMSEVGVVLKRHDNGGNDDGLQLDDKLLLSSQKLYHSKSGLILSYFPDWLIIKWFHFFCFCLFFFVWPYLSPKCIYT